MNGGSDKEEVYTGMRECIRGREHISTVNL